MRARIHLGSGYRGFTPSRGALTLVATALLTSACSGAGTDEPASRGEEAVGQGAAMLSPTCVTLRRTGGAGTGVIYDAVIQKANPTNASGSTNSTLATGSYQGTGQSAPAARQGLMQFDLSSIPSGPGTTVTSAILSMAEGPLNPSAPSTINVHRVTAPWSEASVNWSNFNGAFDPTVSTSFANTGPYGGGIPTPYTGPSSYVAVDVSALVTGWVQGTFANNGLLLDDPTTNTTNFLSSEYPTVGARPKLDVCYACTPGYLDCNGNAADGCEVNSAADVNNCGACGNVCASGICTMGVCQTATCTDGLKNGSETDVDCGGGCPGCANGKACIAATDCASGICAMGICQAPSCNDGLKDGAETDVDCGGGTCATCAAGKGCVASADCQSGVCANGVCQASFCGNGVVDPGEQCDLGAANGNTLLSTCSTSCVKTGLIALFDASNVDGHGGMLADGTPIAAWIDLAGGHDAVQPVSSAQPLFYANAINGKPGLWFPGNSSDVLTSPLNIDYTVLPDVTVVAVFQNQSGAGLYAGVWGQDDGGYDRFLIAGGNGPQGTGISSGYDVTPVPGITAQGTPIISVASLQNGAGPGTSAVYVNGALAQSFAEVHGNSGTAQLSIGNLNGPTGASFGTFSGYISLIAVFDRALTPAEAQAISAQLGAIY
jgi:hypothetical protein